jgi:thymidylate synthase
MGDWTPQDIIAALTLCMLGLVAWGAWRRRESGSLREIYRRLNAIDNRLTQGGEKSDYLDRELTRLRDKKNDRR